MKNTNEKGITLVALVCTIIILLILAGISIATLTGSGLFNKAKEAKQKSQSAQEDEEDKIAQYSNEIDSYLSSNRETVTLTEEEYEMFRSQFSNNENIAKVSINKPNTWLENTEYNFGEGLFGKRFVKNSNIDVNTWYATNLNGGNFIVKVGGSVYNDISAFDINNNFSTYKSTIQIDRENHNLAVYFEGNGTVTSISGFDVWVLYTK